MQGIIFTGLQGAGKSTFYKERFFGTHLRISLDLLKTRHRERRLLDMCVDTRMPFVVDNTNPTRAEREPYIRLSKQAGFRVVGYYFQSRVEDCLRRNQQRAAESQIPTVGLLGTYKKLEIPSIEEGYDELHYVRIAEDGQFIVEEWTDEVR